MKRKIGLDIGDVRIGVAVSDLLGMIANARETYTRKSLNADIKYFCDLAKAEDADEFVLGLPINMDGTMGERVEKTKAFGELLEKESGIKVRYMHSDIDTLERIEIVKGLRLGEFDTLVGINLLREGLDIPEVKLVAILDADKEGFLRSETSLVQTVGRAARNSESRVILYADTVTGSMQRAIDETNRRRKKQTEYNELNNITPKTIVKPITNTLNITKAKTNKKMSVAEIKSEIERLSHKMRQAADILDFEAAIKLREEISSLKRQLRH